MPQVSESDSNSPLYLTLKANYEKSDIERAIHSFVLSKIKCIIDPADIIPKNMVPNLCLDDKLWTAEEW